MDSPVDLKLSASRRVVRAAIDTASDSTRGRVPANMHGREEEEGKEALEGESRMKDFARRGIVEGGACESVSTGGEGRRQQRNGARGH